MKKRLILSIIVLLTTALFVPTLYKWGFLWKKSLHLTTPPQMCPVHGTQMKREMVQATHRFAQVDPGPGSEAERLFPCTNYLYVGGHPRNVGMFEREYCKECREGAQKWHSRNAKEQVVPPNGP